MSSDVSAMTRRGTSTLSRKNKIGLVIAGLLGLSDLVGAFLGPQPGPGEEGPPFVVLVAGSILGAITLIAVFYTWRTGKRVGARVVAGSRIISVLLSLPAFFVEGVPAGLVALTAAGVVVTLVTVALVLSRPADPSV